MLKSATPAGWFAVATEDLAGLLSDHLHCERKAAENALSLVRRYPGDAEAVLTLGRLAHEETSHVVQVSELLARLGHRPRADRPNHYARALLALVRSHEPERKLDALLVAALIEARSHERLACWRRASPSAARPSWPASTGPSPTPRTGTPRSTARWPPAGGPRAEPVEQRLEDSALREAEILGGPPARAPASTDVTGEGPALSRSWSAGAEDSSASSTATVSPRPSHLSTVPGNSRRVSSGMKLQIDVPERDAVAVGVVEHVLAVPERAAGDGPAQRIGRDLEVHPGVVPQPGDLHAARLLIDVERDPAARHAGQLLRLDLQPHRPVVEEADDVTLA